MRSILYHNNSSHGEDAYLRGRKLFVVLDGVSASDGKLATTTVLKHLKKARRTPDGIKRAIAQAHSELLGKNALTTIVGALWQQETWWVFGIGDSPAYDENGERLLPIDAVPGDPAVLTQAIGDGPIEIHEATSDAKQLLLLTDGISDNIDPKEFLGLNKKQIRKLIDQYKSANKSRVYGTWKEDDRTILLINP